MALIRNLAILSMVLAMSCPGGFALPSSEAQAKSTNNVAIESQSEIKTPKARSRAKRLVKTIKVGKISRSYVVNVPAGYGEKPAPVVLVLHGAMANTFSMAWDTRMTEKANEHGFIVVYPRGIGIAKTLMTWNAGDCCGVAKLRNIDDIAF